jgi:FtsH-binding integral membrane protein
MEPYRSSQPAWISASTAEMETRERAFFRSVYGWMFGGLLLTTLAAFWVASSAAMQQLIFGTPLRIVLIFGELGLVLFLSFRIMKMSAAAAAGSFLVFSVLNGLTLSAVLLVYSPTAVVTAFASAAAMFGAMAIYGTVTKRDLTSWGSFFMMGLFGIIILSVINMFVASNGLNFTIGLVGVFVFLGLTAYDNQKLKSYAHAGGGMADNLAVYGALALYLDFINLFLMLLRLFGGRRR